MQDYKLHAIITVGFSGCGKSTFAKEFLKENKGYYHIERDQIRFDTFCEGQRDWSKYKFNRKNEDKVTQIYKNTLDIAFAKGYNLLLTDTFLNENLRNNLIDKLENEGYYVEIKDDWDIPVWEKLVTRNANRTGGIALDVLWKQYKAFWDYKGSYVYSPNLNLPECIVVDIDGTLATKHPDRGYFEWDKVGKDLPRKEVISMVRGLEKDYHIVIASGRDKVCYNKTTTWLDDLGIQYEYLLMRDKGSMEKDYKVKLEMLQHIEKEFNIVGWIDDRPQVSDFLRLVGVNVIQVANPYKYF